MKQGVPKRQNIKFRRRGITQNKSQNIHNTTEVWNQEEFTSKGRKLQDIRLHEEHLRRWNKQCSETSEYKIETQENYPKENM